MSLNRNKLKAGRLFKAYKSLIVCFYPDRLCESAYSSEVRLEEIFRKILRLLTAIRPASTRSILPQSKLFAELKWTMNLSSLNLLDS